MRGGRAGTALHLIVALGACSGDPQGVTVPNVSGLAVREIADGLTSPLYLTAPPGDARLFIVEKPGRIRILAAGVLRTEPFLDITALTSKGGEQGLLSMAFHPDYAANGLFYVSYTDAGGASRIVRYETSVDPQVADAGSATPVLEVAQPSGNHNGGHIAFGPDGYLYVALGDGGGGNDQFGHAQDSTTLLGGMLRIDVDGGSPYAIPPDNPFLADPAAADELWAYGLRNPWRIAFDRVDDRLYVADVGQSRREEINVVPRTAAGVNYGWPVMEGSECFGGGVGCEAGLELPAVEYDHAEGCSVTGGYVYRGVSLPAIRGHYFYSDFCAGFLRSFEYRAGVAAEQRSWSVGPLGRVLSFGEDAAGELYILSESGSVFQLVAGD